MPMRINNDRGNQTLNRMIKILVSCRCTNSMCSWAYFDEYIL